MLFIIYQLLTTIALRKPHDCSVFVLVDAFYEVTCYARIKGAIQQFPLNFNLLICKGFKTEQNIFFVQFFGKPICIGCLIDTSIIHGSGCVFCRAGIKNPNGVQFFSPRLASSPTWGKCQQHFQPCRGCTLIPDILFIPFNALCTK